MSQITDVDVVVIGAGFSGLYATHLLRNKLELRVQSFDDGQGPGGTWYWNRYPGARCDFESRDYSYSFDEDLQGEWKWSERYAAQPEILAYLEHVADRFDLRRSYTFNTRITAVVWNDEKRFWTVQTNHGTEVTARFVVSGVGNLTAPKPNEFPGLETFGGELYRSYLWPHQPVDFTGKRVGVIGTGSTGIQIIPVVAETAEHLTVFQRTPAYACPLGNRTMDDEEWNEIVASYPELREISRKSFSGAPYPAPKQPAALMDDHKTREQTYAEFYDGGGFRMLTSTYGDILTDKDANDTLSDFIRDRIRERVQDPEVAELLCPKDYPYATRRAPFESGYFETFNRDNVDLVDVKSAPIVEVTPTGVRTSAGHYELDVLILATGFDGFTGGPMNLGIVGRNGQRLNDKWEDGARTYLGVAVPGFPNFMMICGPQSAAALYNNALAIEDHVELAADMIQEVISRGAETIEATPESEQRWADAVDGIGALTLLPKVESWYMGANIEGKPRAMLIFAGGTPLCRQITAQVQSTGYGGFAFDEQEVAVPPLLTLDPIALLAAGKMAETVKPLEECTLEETRAALNSFAQLQLPVRESVTVTETSYRGADTDLPARIYVPDAPGPLPVVVFFHPGGFVGGSLDIAHEPCSAMAEDLQAIVVSPGYRLAPEHPFPAAVNDTLAALNWVAETITEYGGDPERLAVAGESAGATLAAVAAQRSAQGEGPRLIAQVLVYPTTEPEAKTESRARYTDGPVVGSAAVAVMWGAYLADPADAQLPLAAPARATTLAGSPPALVLTVEVDPLRDEAEAYGRALQDAGIETQIVRIDGLFHGSFGMSGALPRSRELFGAVTAFLAPRLQASSRDGAEQRAGNALTV